MTSGFTTRHGWLLDRHGRHTLLRGVNLSGATKVPAVPDGATHRGVSIEGWADVSFVGRPAPLDEVDAHLDLIAAWGWNCLRLLTTWEAIEHAGPGRYDEAYLEYYREVVRRAGARGLWVFVDPHQDVWSRWTGGGVLGGGPCCGRSSGTLWVAIGTERISMRSSTSRRSMSGVVLMVGPTSATQIGRGFHFVDMISAPLTGSIML